MANQNNTPKTLYFEGAGWSGADISKATVGNCRIRTAFHLDDGRAVYLEIIACEVTKRSPATWQSFKYAGFVDDCHVIHNDGTKEYMASFAPFEYSHPGILQMVNSLGASFDAVEVLPDLAGYRVHADKGGYNFGDEFRKDDELLTARQQIDEQIRQKEIARGEKSICYSLWVDSEDPAILHYKNFRTGENFDICVAVPNDPKKLPVLNKSNAVVGACYAGGGYLLKVYRITEEYAERYDLMYLDRCEVSNYGDCALGGSDVYRRKSPRV